jgi:hypothetical protein
LENGSVCVEFLPIIIIEVLQKQKYYNVWSLYKQLSTEVQIERGAKYKNRNFCRVGDKR